MSNPLAALSRAQDVLHDALDEARSIASNPGAGAKPRKVAEAVLEASPLVDEALDGWPEDSDGDDGDTYSVANDVELTSAMDRAEPGDVIELAAGDYATTRFKGLGVTFRGVPPLGAVFTKRVEVDVEGEDVRLDGLAFADGLRLGDDTLATGCTIGAKSDDVMACLELAGVRATAEWCDIAGFAHRGVLLTGPDAECRDSRVHGQRPGAASNTDAVAAVMFGGWKAHDEQAQRPLGARLTRCLVDELEWRCAIEGKASGWVVEGCTAIGQQGGRDADCYVRHGTDNRFVSCWVEKGGIQLGGDRHRADGCEATGGIAFKRGGVSMDEMRAGASGYPYARDCVITCTNSAVVTDWANGSGEDWAHMPEGSKVAGVDEGKIQGHGPCEVDEGEAPEPRPGPARKLTPAEVGPEARPRA